MRESALGLLVADDVWPSGFFVSESIFLFVVWQTSNTVALGGRRDTARWAVRHMLAPLSTLPLDQAACTKEFANLKSNRH